MDHLDITIIILVESISQWCPTTSLQSESVSSGPYCLIPTFQRVHSSSSPSPLSSLSSSSLSASYKSLSSSWQQHMERHYVSVPTLNNPVLSTHPSVTNGLVQPADIKGLPQSYFHGFKVWYFLTSHILFQSFSVAKLFWRACKNMFSLQSITKPFDLKQYYSLLRDAPFWNVLFPCGHSRNSFRPPHYGLTGCPMKTQKCLKNSGR